MGGIPVKASHYELSPSQHEIDLQHTDALTMADAVATFRICVKEVARELGGHATFMPKPSDRLAGSGMHLHLSLFDDDGNAFHSEDPRQPLSAIGRSFLAGVLAYAAELTAVPNQWVNSYTRLACGFEAPERIDWAPRAPTRWCASRRTARSARRPRASSCAHPTPAATRTSHSPSCSPPACRGSSAAINFPPRRTARRATGSRGCPRTCARRSTSLRPRRSPARR
jgi:Glutamine synthetase, catalytic domain